MAYLTRARGNSVLVQLSKVSVLGMLFFFISFHFCEGQFLLRYEVEGSKAVAADANFPDSLSRALFLEDFLLALQQEGYPTAIISRKTFERKSLDVRVQPGELFTWVLLSKGTLDERLALLVGYEEKAFERRELNFKNLNKLFDSVLNEAQDSGYPFASIGLDSIVRNDDGLAAAIKFDYGPLITFDTLEVSGDSKTKSIYLSRLLKLIPGGPFSQNKIDQSMRILQKMPFVQLTDDPQLTFQNQTAKLILPLTDRKVNTLDGIIGILPNQNRDNTVLVTGQFDLKLHNVSGRGRNYFLQWQRLSRHSQNLSIVADEPMLFGSMIDLELSFNLLKEDTTFLNRDFKFNFGYSIHPDWYIGFFSRRQAGDLLDASSWSTTAISPDFADFRYNNYGMNLRWTSLDNAWSPRRGWLSEVEFGIGNKKILENTGFSSDAYQEMEKNNTQYNLTLSGERYLSFTPELTAVLKLKGGDIGSATLFLNDLFRLGGLNSIRGFNENFFFTKRYVYANFEPRYYFDRYSYFLLFLDLAGLEDNKRNLDKVLSFGGGLSLETDEGVFNFIYALGQSQKQALGFNFSKIHFGYTGRF